MRVLNAISGCKQKLSLKVNAPVIITMNVAGKAANGQRGNIKAMGDDSITVNLINRDVISLERMPFSRKFSNSLHTRVQFPIKLAWGITVHRCQGQTLSSAVIDFRRVYSSTMLAVALSRCRTEDDIHLMNMDVKGINILHSLSPPSKDHLKFIETGHSPAEVSCQHGKYIYLSHHLLSGKITCFSKLHATLSVQSVCCRQK